ncbi:hypothetical protein ACLB2K_075761 [Fragaria x ananassa]
MECPTRSSSAALVSLLLFFVGAFVFTHLLLNSSTQTLVGKSAQDAIVTTDASQLHPQQTPVLPKAPQKTLEIPLDCPAYNLTGTCTSNYPTTSSPAQDHNRPTQPTCPEYFRWIHEDLKPWAYTGITRDTFEAANRTAAFKLVIVNGKAYYQKYVKAFQSRDTFTLWGILQLLRRYPGKVPDLELMFDCVDWPVILSSSFTGSNSTAPPPLFRYCGDNNTLDIVFPDWSFWGWPETNIAPWENLLEQLVEGNRRSRWVDREPYAYWKGNPKVAETRQDLLKCNVSEEHEWNARVYAQASVNLFLLFLLCLWSAFYPSLSLTTIWIMEVDNVLENRLQNWTLEEKAGFKKSDLASQCVHKYKIYIEGSAWSVSNKYILACDSVTLLVRPRYYDFFMRGLMPVHHYWPVKDDDKCRSIKYAVDWGNSHQKKESLRGISE